MATPTEPVSAADLPRFPGAREARCPFSPPPEYAEWRDAEGLPHARLGDGTTAWVVSRYDDTREVLGEKPISAETAPGFAAESFPRMDDPEHARLRLMLTRDFTVKHVQKLRPEIEELTESTLDAFMARQQPADFVGGVALPIPSGVISVMLGVPDSDHAFFQEHANTISQTDASEEAKGAATGALFQYLSELAEQKQADPGDDLISRLITEYVATGELDLRAVAVTGMTLLIAGHETTGNMIGLSVMALLEHPEFAEQIRDADPRTLARGVEELLRYLSIAQSNIERLATEDFTVNGQLIRSGDKITMALPAANRDDSWTEDPDVLDIDRNARTHLAFGYGIHQCLGQHLARLELQIVLPAVLRRMPELRLAVGLEEIDRRDNMAVYGVRELPVRW